MDEKVRFADFKLGGYTKSDRKKLNELYGAMKRNQRNRMQAEMKAKDWWNRMIGFVVAFILAIVLNLANEAFHGSFH